MRSESITTIPSTSVTKLLQGVEKSYDKGKKLLEESKSLTDIKYRTSSEIDAEYPSTSATDPESKTSRATEISEHLNTPVRVIMSEKEMEGLSPRQKKAKGWYNTATGEVVVVVSNNADVADVENTVLHEVIGHDGIRVLFPDEKKLNNALDEMYRVKITLKENVKTKEDKSAHSYEATKIELMAGQHGDVTMTSPRYSNSSISSAKLLKDVGMSYNPERKLLEESKKVSDKLSDLQEKSDERYRTSDEIDAEKTERETT